MKKYLSFVVCVLTILYGLLLTSSTAVASTTWSWTETGGGISASGLFTTAGNALTPEPILSVSGEMTGPISGSLSLHSGFFGGIDDLFKSSYPFFDSYGPLMDVVGSGGTGLSIMYFVPGCGLYGEVFTTNGGLFVVSPVTFTATSQVPEPGIAALLFLGFGGLLVLRRRMG